MHEVHYLTHDANNNEYYKKSPEGNNPIRDIVAYWVLSYYAGAYCVCSDAYPEYTDPDPGSGNSSYGSK